ncbi:MAG: hypothetical protein MRECE_27c011 [Mycoplasmataceae bacterium CE_OT135]|nr:MAG: hypothetical protein MRECE_27c011 [Mycoplasmataceae bacterium CE_OT135]
MKIKFKLLEKKPTNQGLQLQVSECSYDKQIINKITLKHNHKFLTNAENNQFIIKNIRDNEIEFKSNTNELIIDSPNCIIFPTKTDFLFAVNKIEKISHNWEIELAFPHAWNGEKITKIRLSAADDQDQRMIEENKNESFFTISGIKKYDLLPATGKTEMLILSANDFRDLEKSVLFQPEPVEIFVKNPKKESNHYLIKCQGDLAKIGLKDYQKIRIIFHQGISDGDVIKFNLTNLKEILQRDKEDGILRINNNYHSFAKLQTGSAASAHEQAQKTIQKKSQKFQKKYQNEQAERINMCQKSLEKYSVFLQQLHDKFNDPASQELINQKNSLSQKLTEFASQRQLERKIALLERQIFFTMPDYQNQDKIDQFQQELGKIDQEFTELTEKIEKYQSSLGEHLKKKWVSIYENDPQLQQLFAKNKVSQQGFFDSLEWNEGHFWIKEDGSIDYLALERYIQEQNSHDGLPNDLGYFPQDLKEGNELKKWNEAQIKKIEAEEAIHLGYSPEQWKDPQYQEYKDKPRILADSMIEVFQRDWNPPLSAEHKKEIKGSWSDKLAEDILKVQKERFKNQAKTYFKAFIEQELKKSPTVNADELGAYSSYATEIEKRRDWKGLENYLERLIAKINQARESKISSLSEAQEQAKKNINETFQKTKIKTQELHQQHQNWAAKMEKMESISAILQFEQDFTLLLEKINCFSRQQWFPNFGQRERNQIKRAKDPKDLQKRMASREGEKKKWLLIWQINKYLSYYQELQEEVEQDYFAQHKQLSEARLLLNKIDESSLNSEQMEMKKTLEKMVEPISYLYFLRGNQRVFNKVTSAKLKQEQLQQLQEELQKITKKRKLTETEIQIQQKAEQNFRLIQQGKTPEKFILINEKQTELELLTLEPEVKGENDSTTENTNDQDWVSQKTLVIFALVGLILIFFWRWYRKKKEEDPFW